jgi:hypothetical protein
MVSFHVVSSDARLWRFSVGFTFFLGTLDNWRFTGVPCVLDGVAGELFRASIGDLVEWIDLTVIINLFLLSGDQSLIQAMYV